MTDKEAIESTTPEQWADVIAREAGDVAGDAYRRLVARGNHRVVLNPGGETAPERFGRPDHKHGKPGFTHMRECPLRLVSTALPLTPDVDWTCR